MKVKKRSRMKNYTPFEENLILNMVIANKSIVENKKTDSATNAKKEQCWIQFSKTFNQLGYKRTHAQLKLKWDNMKKVARKRASNIQEEAMRIGGVPSQVPPLNPMDRKILRKILSNGDELNDGCDSDTVEMENSHDSHYVDVKDPDIVFKEEDQTNHTCDSSSWNPVDISMLHPSTSLEQTVNELNQGDVRPAFPFEGQNELQDPCEPRESDNERLSLPDIGVRKRKKLKSHLAYVELLKHKAAAAKVEVEIKEIEKNQKARTVERAEELHQMQLKMLQADLESKLAAEKRLEEKHVIEIEFLKAQAKKGVDMNV